MTKPANKTPTIQDLTRDELLRLIPMIHPFRVHPRAILRAQWDVACEQRAALSEVELAAAKAAAAAAGHFSTALKARNAKAMERCRRGYIAASEAVDIAGRKTRRASKRCDRLYEQLRALDQEG